MNIQTCIYKPVCSCVEKAVRAVIRGRGGLFDHVNQTGTRTQVKGAPTNKKQCKSGQNGTGIQHETWSEREKNTTSTTKEKKCSHIKDWGTIFPWVKPVQGESGKVLCEVCLNHFSVSHGGESDVKQHRQCETHKKHYNLKNNCSPDCLFSCTQSGVLTWEALWNSMKAPYFLCFLTWENLGKVHLNKIYLLSFYLHSVMCYWIN